MSGSIDLQKGKSVKKRLSNGTVKEYTYTAKVYKHFKLLFDSEAEKLRFEEKLEHFKQFYGMKTMTDVFDFLLNDEVRKVYKSESEEHKQILNKAAHANFVCENNSLFELVEKICSHQQICSEVLIPTLLDHTGHVAEINWQCEKGHNLTWTSSKELGKNFSVNYSAYLGQLCSGMAASQYERFCDFLDIGVATKHFRQKTAITMSNVIGLVTRQSVQNALVEEVASSSENKISIMTDARHHCRKNSFHTDHVALGATTHKVINMQHITKDQEKSTQKHETVGCERMYAEFDKKGINVKVHIHDRNMSVNKTVKGRESVANCNERWHATKSVTQGVKAISTGSKKNMGITWHPQLADKGARIRNHLYHAIDSCGGNGTELRRIIESCVPHFQNNHEACSEESECKNPAYVPEFTVLTDSAAAKLLLNFLHSLTLYKNAQDYALSKDTYYVESFNNAMLIYLDKRVHMRNRTYEMRRDLAILDWNEHVDRPFTSRCTKQQVQNCRRNLGTKRYKKKSYKFVEEIWTLLTDVLKSNDEDSDSSSDDDSSDDDF
ncbi:MAG: hypothetical protein AB2693_14230 [Candidatus Thiodiazotropha sp.]